jgi:hypothetical protein
VCLLLLLPPDPAAPFVADTSLPAGIIDILAPNCAETRLLLLQLLLRG